MPDQAVEGGGGEGGGGGSSDNGKKNIDSRLLLQRVPSSSSTSEAPKRKMYRKSRKKAVAAVAKSRTPSPGKGIEFGEFDSSGEDGEGEGGDGDKGESRRRRNDSTDSAQKKKRKKKDANGTRQLVRRRKEEEEETSATVLRQSKKPLPLPPVKEVTGTTKASEAEKDPVAFLFKDAPNSKRGGRDGIEKLNQAKVEEGGRSRSDRRQGKEEGGGGGDDLSSGRTEAVEMAEVRRKQLSRNGPDQSLESVMAKKKVPSFQKIGVGRAQKKIAPTTTTSSPTKTRTTLLLDDGMLSSRARIGASLDKKADKKKRALTETEAEAYDVQQALEQVLEDLNTKATFEYGSAESKMKKKLKAQLETELNLLGWASKSRAELEEVSLLDDNHGKGKRRQQSPTSNASSSRKAKDQARENGSSALLPLLKGDTRRKDQGGGGGKGVNLQKKKKKEIGSSSHEKTSAQAAARSQSVPRGGAMPAATAATIKPKPGENKTLYSSSQTKTASSSTSFPSEKRQKSRSLSPDQNKGGGEGGREASVGHNQDGSGKRDGKRGAEGDEMLIANQGNILDDGTKQKRVEEEEEKSKEGAFDGKGK